MATERQVEIVVRDGAPERAIDVVDMSTGRRIGALKRLSLSIDAEDMEGRCVAEMVYLGLEGSPDGTVPPDRAEPVVPRVDESGDQERITETVRVIRFTPRVYRL